MPTGAKCRREGWRVRPQLRAREPGARGRLLQGPLDGDGRRKRLRLRLQLQGRRWRVRLACNSAR